jgi:hypothetical protein
LADSRVEETRLILPKSLDDFLNRYTIEIPEQVSWQTKYFKARTKRDLTESLYEASFTTPMHESLPNPRDYVAESLEGLIKSTLLSPETSKDRLEARDLLVKAGAKAVGSAMQNLINNKLVVKTNPGSDSSNTGQNYRLSER